MNGTIDQNFCTRCKIYKGKLEFANSNSHICNMCKAQTKRYRENKKLLKDDNEVPNEILEPNNLADYIYDLLELHTNSIIAENNKENNQLGIHYSCTVDISSYNESSKEIADNLINIVSDTDEYSWIYNNKYDGKQATSIWYFCSQRVNMAKKPRKHNDPEKQRDTKTMERFDCNGCIKVNINLTLQIARITVEHNILHSKPNNVAVPEDVKQYIKNNIDLLPREIYARLIDKGMDTSIVQKQIHYWWATFGSNRYIRHNDAFKSALMWIEEECYKVIVNTTTPVRAIGFLTGLLDDFKRLNINIWFELYVLHAEVNGSGYPIAYLFVESNSKSGNGIRTEIILIFLNEIKLQGVTPEFVLTDKDFAQISGIRFTWPNTKIQLCRWHVKKAIDARLISNKFPQKITYKHSNGNEYFSFIDKTFVLQLPAQKGTIFCPEELRTSVWELMDKHLHLHPLIPISSNLVLTCSQIWEQAVKEIYFFCKNNSLPFLWIYLWKEWYCADRWALWMRAGYENKISVLKTTMFIESHWKTIKRDFLYKFFRPRLDLVIYILMKKVILHQRRKFDQIMLGRVNADWRKAMKSEWKRLTKKVIKEDSDKLYITDIERWICSCPYYLTNRFFICKHLVQKKGTVSSQFFDQVKRSNQYPFLVIMQDISSSMINMDNNNQINNQIEDNHNQINQIETTKAQAISLVHAVSFSMNNNNINNDQVEEDSDAFFNRLINTTKKALDLLYEHKDTKNIKWGKSIEKNFLSVNTMVEQIEAYRRRITMPKTWKEHTHNT
ncbi:3850_t:CDS:2, partial [Scutellospora calospora]